MREQEQENQEKSARKGSGGKKRLKKTWLEVIDCKTEKNEADMLFAHVVLLKYANRFLLPLFSFKGNENGNDKAPHGPVPLPRWHCRQEKPRISDHNRFFSA